MKRFLLTLITITIVAQPSSAQVRHLKGQRGVEIRGGISEHSQLLGAGYLHQVSSRIYLKGAGFYEDGSISGVNFKSYLVDLTVYYTLLKIAPLLYFNVGLGGSGIYEETEILEQTILQKGFAPGALGTVELELFLSNHWALIFSGSQRYYFNSSLGSGRWMASGGLRYIFN